MSIEASRPPRVVEIEDGMPVTFTVERDGGTTDISAFIADYTYRDPDDNGADYPKRILCEEYHDDGNGNTLITQWKLDPLRHRVWKQADCDDDFERNGDLADITA